MYRDEFLAQATKHGEAEIYYRRLVSSVPVFGLQAQKVVGESMPLDEGSTAIDTTGERWSSLSESDSSRQERHAHDRFKEAQARSRATMDTAISSLPSTVRGNWSCIEGWSSITPRSHANTHAAAARPWLSVAPDPPEPR